MNLFLRMVEQCQCHFEALSPAKQKNDLHEVVQLCPEFQTAPSRCPSRYGMCRLSPNSGHILLYIDA